MAIELRAETCNKSVVAKRSDQPGKVLQYQIERKPMPDPSPDLIFDEAWYLEQYSDVADVVRTGAGLTAIDHFLWHGRQEGRSGYFFDLGCTKMHTLWSEWILGRVGQATRRSITSATAAIVGTYLMLHPLDVGPSRD